MKKRKISFGELKLDDKVDKYWAKIRETNWVSMGSLVEEFEEKFANLFNVKYAVAMSNGTDADINMLLTLYETHDAKPGDEIIIPAMAFFAVASSVVAAGFKPVFVDIDIQTLNIDPYKIEEKITTKTKAIMAVNTIGRPIDVPILQYIAKKHKIACFIDNCEGHGCKYDNQFMESYFPLVSYSCYQAHLIQSAEYGFVCTNNKDLADLLRCTRTHGRANGLNSFNHTYLGYNSKPTDLHSIIGLSQIDKFWSRFTKRRYNIQSIQNGLKDYRKYMYFSEDDEHCYNSPHALSIVLTSQKYNINSFKEHLSNYWIDWKLNFLCIPEQQSGIQKFVPTKSIFTSSNYPYAWHAGNYGIHFGCHEYLTEDDCNYIVWVIKQYFDKEMWHDKA